MTLQEIHYASKTQLAVFILEHKPEYQDKKYRIYSKRRLQLQKLAYNIIKEVKNNE